MIFYSNNCLSVFYVEWLSRPEIAIQKKKSLLWKNAAIM